MPQRLGESVPFLLNRALTRFVNLFARHLDDHGVSLPMWRVLAVLDEEGELRLGDVARLTCTELSTLSRVAAAMEAKGLIRRRRSGSDARAVLAALTPEGKAVAEAIRPHAQECEGRAVNGMSDEEVDLLKQLLGRLSGNAAGLAKAANAH